MCVAVAACSSSKQAGCPLSKELCKAQIKVGLIAPQVLKSKFMAHLMAYRGTTWGRHPQSLPCCTLCQLWYMRNSHMSMPICAMC